ncbi:hypothetical protein chiPu_0024113, partial [Chiloscyllium punctatum]|nr:hypothetical protein [Chiloscyllium punctatum]
NPPACTMSSDEKSRLVERFPRLVSFILEQRWLTDNFLRLIVMIGEEAVANEHFDELDEVLPLARVSEQRIGIKGI